MPGFVISVFALFAAILIIPSSREIFENLSGNHPYLMGFVKFAEVIDAVDWKRFVSFTLFKTVPIILNLKKKNYAIFQIILCQQIHERNS